MFSPDLDTRIARLLHQLPEQRRQALEQQRRMSECVAAELTSAQTLTSVAVVGLVLGMQSPNLKAVTMALLFQRIKRSISALTTA
ncbi:hypothetical protein [Pseudidiomarina sp. YC-516-91]|uniref:hypothetical protein n=1 Tax=Pseudidiomarina salilacus TaxID=3384452 RepID=UPI0039854B9E